MRCSEFASACHCLQYFFIIHQLPSRKDKLLLNKAVYFLLINLGQQEEQMMASWPTNTRSIQFSLKYMLMAPESLDQMYLPIHIYQKAITLIVIVNS